MAAAAAGVDGADAAAVAGAGAATEAAVAAAAAALHNAGGYGVVIGAGRADDGD